MGRGIAKHHSARRRQTTQHPIANKAIRRRRIIGIRFHRKSDHPGRGAKHRYRTGRPIRPKFPQRRGSLFFRYRLMQCREFVRAHQIVIVVPKHAGRNQMKTIAGPTPGKFQSQPHRFSRSKFQIIVRPFVVDLRPSQFSLHFAFGKRIPILSVRLEWQIMPDAIRPAVTEFQ